jgi:hypothetical protein
MVRIVCDTRADLIKPFHSQIDVGGGEEVQAKGVNWVAGRVLQEWNHRVYFVVQVMVIKTRRSAPVLPQTQTAWLCRQNAWTLDPSTHPK